jgi:WD40 repeat protein
MYNRFIEVFLFLEDKCMKKYLCVFIFVSMLLQKLLAGGVSEVVFSSNGNYIASATSYNTRPNSPSVKIWDAETGNLIKTLASDTGIYSIAYSPNGEQIIGGCSEGVIKIWNINNGQLVRTIRKFSSDIASVAYNPNGNQFAAANVEGVKIFDAEDGQEIMTLANSKNSNVIVFSPDGKQISSGTTENNLVKIWNVENGQEMITLRGHTDFIFSLAYSPDGQFLASGSNEGVVKIWNASNGQEVMTISIFRGRQNTRKVSDIAWISNTTIVFVSNSKNVLEIWDIRNNKELLSMASGPLNTVAFNKNRNIIIAGEKGMTRPANEKIYIFDASTGNIIKTLLHRQD